MKGRGFFGAVTIAFALGTSMPPALSGDVAETFSMRGWVSVTVPVGFTGRQTGGAIVIDQDGGLRTPLQIQVVRGRFASVLRGKTRQTKTGPATYDIRKRETGGSGGPEWRLRIDHPLATVLAVRQNELGPPDFTIVWEVVNSIRTVED